MKNSRDNKGDNVHTTYAEGSTTYSTDSALIDSLISRHAHCELVDYESNTTYCYSCNAGARWIG